jgi:hypothetical protein
MHSHIRCHHGARLNPSTVGLFERRCLEDGMGRNLPGVGDRGALPRKLRFYTDRIADCQENIAAAGPRDARRPVDMVTAPPDDQLQLFLIRRISIYGAAREKKVFYETLLRQARGDLMIEEARMAETREKLRITREKRRNLDAEIARRGAPPPPAEDVNDANVLE